MTATRAGVALPAGVCQTGLMSSQAPFDQSKHRRVPAGRRGAGRFTHNPAADDPPGAAGMRLSEDDTVERSVPRKRRVTNAERLTALGFDQDPPVPAGQQADKWIRYTHDGAWVCAMWPTQGWRLSFHEGRTSTQAGVVIYREMFKSCTAALRELMRQTSGGAKTYAETLRELAGPRGVKTHSEALRERTGQTDGEQD